MAETSIEWTDRSINPIRARHRKTGAIGHYCELFSTGCAHCYASNFQKRFGMPPFPGKSRLPKLPVVDDRGCVIVNEEIELFLDESKLDEVLKRRKPAKWFWCDMTDLFGSWVPDEWIDRCFAVMNATAHQLPIPIDLNAKPWHTHQILTKRPERMFHYMESRSKWRDSDTNPLFVAGRHDGGVLRGHGVEIMNAGACLLWPMPNVWLGVSCENQQTADERIPWLLKTPAAVRFLSCEPLLGPIEWNHWTNAIGWVIAGGESGHNARPMHPDWARSLRDQCQAVGVPFFFKQWGEWASQNDTPRTVERNSWGLYRVGKHAAGRLLDGREWSEFPQTEPANA
jgi:protein gp37